MLHPAIEGTEWKKSRFIHFLSLFNLCFGKYQKTVIEILKIDPKIPIEKAKGVKNEVKWANNRNLIKHQHMVRCKISLRKEIPNRVCFHQKSHSSFMRTVFLVVHTSTEFNIIINLKYRLFNLILLLSSCSSAVDGTRLSLKRTIARRYNQFTSA